MTENANRILLPAGLEDVLPPEAAREARVVEELLATFARHGYERVKPPLIEFEESLLAGHGAALASQMFRLMDPISQRMMGVRTDITLQVARIAASRLASAPRPLRLSYAGQVLRVRGTQLRPERQFAQAGVELIGCSALAAEAEVVLLAAEAPRAVGVRGISVDLTLPTLVPAICASVGLGAEATAAVRRAMDQKDAAALADAVKHNGAREAEALLSALLRATGPADEVLDRLSVLDLPRQAHDLYTALGDLVGQVRRAAPDLMLTIDPGESHGFEYQTGISFTLFGRGVRGELGRGGRYDTGAGETAVGFTLYLDSLLRGLPPASRGERLYLPFGLDPAEGHELRSQGWRTVQGLEPERDDQAEAKRLGCTHFFQSGSAVALT